MRAREGSGRHRLGPWRPTACPACGAQTEARRVGAIYRLRYHFRPNGLMCPERTVTGPLLP